jgi:hypothetical protein
MAKTKTELPAAITASPDYQRVAELLQSLGSVQFDLALKEASVNARCLALINRVREEIVIMQSQEAALLAELQQIAEAHPKWFADARSLKLITGTLKFHASTTTEVDDPELTFAALEREEKAALADRRVFFADDYLRTKREPNLDTLATLDDATLARLHVRRVPNISFKAIPATLDLGKAVKQAAAEEAA